jgi:hypothetical protein
VAAPISHENIRETNAVEPSLCFAKIGGKVNQGSKNLTVQGFLRLDQVHFVEALYDFRKGSLGTFNLWIGRKKNTFDVVTFTPTLQGRQDTRQIF